jgi:hypothetical protein
MNLEIRHADRERDSYDPAAGRGICKNQTVSPVAGTLKFCICNDKKNACRIVVGFEMAQATTGITI